MRSSSLVHLHGADAAGHAFAAALVHAEFHEELGDVDHAGTLVHDDQAAGAHDRAQGPQAFVVDRRVQMGGRDAAAGGTAGLRGLEGKAVRNAAADVEDDLAQRDAHRHFDQAGGFRPCRPGQRSWCLCSWPCRSLQTTRRHALMIGAMLPKVSTLLISVGLPHRPLWAGIGRARYRLATAAHDRGHQCGLFAADEGAGADAHVDAEVETRCRAHGCPSRPRRSAARMARSRRLAATGYSPRT